MKKIRILSLLWVILFIGTLAGCGNNKPDWTWDFIIEDITWENEAVINYNDTLVNLASQCIISEDAIRNVYNNETSEIEDFQKSIDNTISECTNALKNIENLGDWEWDSSLKDWVLNIIQKEIDYYSKFKELLPYMEKEDLTDNEVSIYNNLFSEIESLDDELSQANKKLMSIQEAFAKNYWFELESENPEEITE